MAERTLGKATLLGACCLVLATAAGCGSSDDTGSGPSGTGGSGSTATPAYIAVVRGTLASSDMAQAQAAHDQIAKTGEAAAKAAGDVGHTVFLGTTLLDSVKNEFLAVDRWTDADHMKAFYADPQIGQAFASLFAAPPSIEFYQYEPTWVSWGDLNSGEAYQPSYYHLALGELKDSDPTQAQAAHDQVASGGKQPSLDAGDVAHVVYLGLDDSQAFLGVDIWKSSDNIQAFYTNPQFVAAFGGLFQTATQPVYESTDWYQW
jgi:quinol monooxygenase YgiN